MAQKAIDFVLTAHEKNTAANLKRLRQQSDEGDQSKAKRRANIKAKCRLNGTDRGAE